MYLCVYLPLFQESGKKDKLTTASKDQSLTWLSQINLVDIFVLSAE